MAFLTINIWLENSNDSIDVSLRSNEAKDILMYYVILLCFIFKTGFAQVFSLSSALVVIREGHF